MNHADTYAELFNQEDDVILAAREQAAELGCSSISTGAGFVLQLLAGIKPAKTVVEIGTGVGISGLHLLAGMPTDGILTTIDIEPEFQRVAKEAFRNANIAPNRVRLINGQALQVLPRLTDYGYDMVVVHTAPTLYPQCVTEGLRLLAPHGLLVLLDALGGGKVPDPTQRDADTVALREAARLIREQEDMHPVILPLGDGILAAVRG